MTSTEIVVTGERADLLQLLAKHRGLFRFTAQGVTDEQARLRTTVSELTLGGLIKHVATVEQSWVRFIQHGPDAMASGAEDWADQHRLVEGETLEGQLARYEEIARETDELLATIEDLDASQPLPAAPWFEPGARWSARRVFVHIIAETAQHAGHADIIREALDGQKSMG
ncbi:DinB family protein [Actinokineospora sp. HUAS TT18]|uniref:DinB family protein n=1 Tax=Actinokineospora sp. HUAS TT18 TaxID=3447451 RepID=UPI003F51CB1C